MAIHTSGDLLSALIATATGRDHIETAEFARAVNHASQTIRKNYCINGHCFGIRPIKVGNKLLWPLIEVARVLKGA